MNVNVQIVISSTDKLDVLKNIAAAFGYYKKYFDQEAQSFRLKQTINVTNGKILLPNVEETAIAAVDIVMSYKNIKDFADNVTAAGIGVIRINYDACGASGPVLFFEFTQVNNEKKWQSLCDEHNVCAEIYPDKIICAMHNDKEEYPAWCQSFGIIKKKNTRYISYRKKEA